MLEDPSSKPGDEDETMLVLVFKSLQHRSRLYPLSLRSVSSETSSETSSAESESLRYPFDLATSAARVRGNPLSLWIRSVASTSSRYSRACVARSSSFETEVARGGVEAIVGARSSSDDFGSLKTYAEEPGLQTCRRASTQGTTSCMGEG